MTEKCIELLDNAYSVLSVTAQSLQEGKIQVGHLRKIISQRENILRLVEAVLAKTSAKNELAMHVLERVLEVRAKELQMCDQYLNQAVMLMSFCKQVKAGMQFILNLMLAKYKRRNIKIVAHIK